MAAFLVFEVGQENREPLMDLIVLLVNRRYAFSDSVSVVLGKVRVFYADDLSLFV